MRMAAPFSRLLFKKGSAEQRRLARPEMNGRVSRDNGERTAKNDRSSRLRSDVRFDGEAGADTCRLQSAAIGGSSGQARRRRVERFGDSSVENSCEHSLRFRWDMVSNCFESTTKYHFQLLKGGSTVYCNVFHHYLNFCSFIIFLVLTIHMYHLSSC